MRENTYFLGETITKYMAGGTRPQGPKRTNVPRRAHPKMTRDPTRETMREADDVEWDLQHTLNSYESPKGSLTPSHFLSMNVHSRYDEGGK